MSWLLVRHGWFVGEIREKNGEECMKPRDGEKKGEWGGFFFDLQIFFSRFAEFFNFLSSIKKLSFWYLIRKILLKFTWESEKLIHLSIMRFLISGHNHFLQSSEFLNNRRKLRTFKKMLKLRTYTIHVPKKNYLKTNI